MSVGKHYSNILNFYDKIRGKTRLRHKLIRLEQCGWDIEEAKCLTSSVFQIGMSKDTLLATIQKELEGPEPGTAGYSILDAHVGQKFSRDQQPNIDYTDNHGCDTYFVHHFSFPKDGIVPLGKKYRLTFHFLLKDDRLMAIGISRPDYSAMIDTPIEA
ncbi:hypothetical protein [Labrys wisconsinensis]|uniref:Uncharacterized protein n=1 Tax=Labrys wisconsinensis TaxID=425677 RepID=A0ABU0JNF9_9HYPH|nr:hypothetical protein [Labrys wisconsinensis]MDQ0474824.1 hypothetical protein [Labrys wisconsinensis]